MHFKRSPLGQSILGALGLAAVLAAGPVLAASTPMFSAHADGTTRATTLSVTIIPADADVGKAGNLYVGGVLNGVLYLKDGKTGNWLPAKAGSYPVAAQVSQLKTTTMEVLKGQDMTPILGADVYVGYGTDEADMINNHKFASVLKIQGTRDTKAKAKNVIFFLGDGYGIPVMTASRIYAVGEDGSLTIDTFPETGFVRTYSNDSQVTDSAPSMSAYMTGVKMNNEVLSMTPDTIYQGKTGMPVTTFLELAKAQGMGTGVVTTTRVTHATPAATYAHINDRDQEDVIAAQLVPGGAKFNSLLKDGVDVVLGGGCSFFVPKSTQCSGSAGKRTDDRNLINELKGQGYAFVSDRAGLDGVSSSTKKLLGLFTSSHMTYDLDRDASKEPSLAQMTTKAMDLLGKSSNGYFLMVEGGRIDHALHETNAVRALQDAFAFDQAIKAAINKVKETDPNLANTLIVVTADHDHTMVLNGYAKRTGATTATNPGVLGVAKSYVDGSVLTDADKMPYTILGFGNGENRAQGSRSAFTALTDAVTGGKDYHQEAVVRMPVGSETHGGTDVFIGAMGAGADTFHGFMDNTKVFTLLRDASGI